VVQKQFNKQNKRPLFGTTMATGGGGAFFLTGPVINCCGFVIQPGVSIIFNDVLSCIFKQQVVNGQLCGAEDFGS